MSYLICPLCKTDKANEFCHDKKRSYLRCELCNLTFVPPEFYLSLELEQAEYDLHQNNPDDQGYRQFLCRLYKPMMERIKDPACGLDFGSGPGPTLSLMFEEAGHKMEIFDKIYAPDEKVFEKQYDFITATEVFEHLHNPKAVLDRLWQSLKPDAWLGVMTKLALGLDEFKKWHYINDMTHVCFFSKETFSWLAEQLNAELAFADKDVVLFRKRKINSAAFLQLK